MPTRRVPPPLLSALVEQSEVGFAVLDRELRFVGLNEALAQMNGVPISGHLGRTLEEVIPEVAREARQPFEQVFARDEPIRDLEIRSTTPAGEGVWLESVYPLRSNEGEVEAIGVVVVDIVHRARAEAELDSLNTLLEEVLQRAPVGLAVFDSDFRFTRINDALAEINRRPVEAHIGRRVDEVLGPLASPVLALLREVAETQQPIKDVEFQEPGDGATRHFLANYFPLPQGAVGSLVIDATEQVREHQLARTLQDSLMPEAVHAHSGLEVACGYLPAGSVARVGGDWFDTVDLPGDDVLLIVGDVAGHGVQAAAEMGELSAVLRSQALAGAAPAACLDFLRRYSAARPHFPFATVCCCRLSPASGELRYARAGHPPPLLIGPEGSRYLDGGLGAAIGIDVEPADEPAEDSVRLGSEDTVLLYTDGLIEQGRPGYDAGLERLAGRIDPQAAAPSRLVEGIEAELAAEELEDDVALLAFALS
jgi:PAS domain S-box-containing protein